MYALLIFSAVSVIDPIVAIRDRVDKVECNHFYDNNGRHVFDQIIYWDWNEIENRYDVVDWRSEKECTRLYSTAKINGVSEYDSKLAEHIKFYQDEAITNALEHRKKLLDIKEVKYKINEDKFRSWYLENHSESIYIPDFVPYEYVGSSFSIPIEPLLLRFVDTKDRTLKEIRFKILIHTYTTVDPEVENREILSQEQRRGIKINNKPMKDFYDPQ